MQNHQPVVCPGCTCLCDDIEISLGQDSVVARNACQKGQDWFASPSVPKPAHRVNGVAIEFEGAIKAGAKLLANSSAPLICGLECLTTGSQQAAWKLADQLGAAIDSKLGNSGRASMFALQRVGKVTATLGEVASRSDLVVFWFCDPVATHPRHLERYSHPANGHQRTVIVIDEHETDTAKQADVFFKLEKSSAASAVSIIRAVIAGLSLDEQVVLEKTGRSLGDWNQLTAQIKSARYGAFFYGHTTHESAFDVVTDSIALLVRELNRQTRFVCLGMRDDFNGKSAENVLAWSSGFPMAVNLHRRFPRSHWLEYSAETILARRECDVILLASTGSLELSLASMNKQAIEHFHSTPKIVIAESNVDLMAQLHVEFQVSQPGKNVTGDFCRQDDVALPLTSFAPTKHGIHAGEVLERLLVDCQH